MKTAGAPVAGDPSRGRKGPGRGDGAGPKNCPRDVEYAVGRLGACARAGWRGGLGAAVPRWPVWPGSCFGAWVFGQFAWWWVGCGADASAAPWPRLWPRDGEGNGDGGGGSALSWRCWTRGGRGAGAAARARGTPRCAACASGACPCGPGVSWFAGVHLAHKGVPAHGAHERLLAGWASAWSKQSRTAFPDVSGRAPVSSDHGHGHG